MIDPDITNTIIPITTDMLSVQSDVSSHILGSLTSHIVYSDRLKVVC